MEAALVSVSTGAMEPLLSKLTKLLGDEYVKLKGMRKQIRFLRDELSTMSATLQMLADAEDQLNPQMKDWRDKLRELAYDIEDCVDTFMARVDHDDGGGGPTGVFQGLFHKFRKLVAQHEIANQIQELKARAAEVSERHKRYNFTTPSESNFAIDPRLPALYQDIERLVGMDGPKKHVLDWMTMDSKELKVLPIVGCGGLGKTTLASQVYHTIKSQFSCAAFVSVSRNPNIRKILSDIAEEMKIPDDKLNDDERQLIDKLRNHLLDKRYIVVIDDLWDAKAWETIKLSLLSNNCGSRIIITTRSLTIASCCSTQGGYVYQMAPLSFDDSKKLFFKRAFGSENSKYPHLEDVPDKILGKCGGLPLAITTISGVLVDQHAKGEWDRVLNSIGSGLARNPNAENMKNILSLSYFDLPHHLRTCLLYLSVFPEDFEIKKQCLISRWIAEGFIIGYREQGHSAYEIGEHYFNDLINKSLIQPVGVKFGQARACRVHDIILDYIKCKAAEENFVTSLDGAVEQGRHTSEYKIRRLCLNNNNNEKSITIWAGLILSHIRSFSIFGHPMQTSLLPFTALRVLDLEIGGWEDHHLANIENLFHLKYLRLCSDTVTSLPEKIGGLHSLETLDVQGCRIDELPSTIAKLQRLVRLYVHWNTTFPDGMLRQMHSLEELRHHRVQTYEQRKSSVQEFSNLTKLRTLKVVWEFDWEHESERILEVEDLQNYLKSLMSSCNLHDLYIRGTFEGCVPLSLDSCHPIAPCALQKLRIKYCVICNVPKWMGSLGNLTVLKLDIYCLRPEDVEILGTIPSLLFLQIGTEGGVNGRITVQGNNGFRCLKYFSLDIYRCGTALEFRPGSMPRVEHLDLRLPVHKAECLNGASDMGVQHLCALNKVEVVVMGKCDQMEDMYDGIVKSFAGAIKDAAKILPNRPTISLKVIDDGNCEHYEYSLKWVNEMYGVLTEWLKIWQIEKDKTEQLDDGNSEQHVGEPSH